MDPTPTSRINLEDIMLAATASGNAPASRIDLDDLVLAAAEAEKMQATINSRRANTFLQTLPTAAFSDIPGDDQCCSVCFEDYEDDGGMTVVKLPCAHCFHAGCISAWLSPFANPSSNTCPLCRAVLFKIGQVRPSREEILERIDAMRERRVRGMEAGMEIIGDDMDPRDVRRRRLELCVVFCLVMLILCIGTSILLAISGKLLHFLKFLVRS